MPKRGENIHKRKDGRWEGRLKTGLYSNGKSVYKSIYGKTYSEVKSKMYFEKSNSMNMNVIRTREYTFGEVLILWSNTNRAKHRGTTEVKYNYLIRNHILPELGDFRVSNITNHVLNDFMERKLHSGRLDKKGGLSKSYVRSIMIIINSALEFAVSQNMCKPLKTVIYKPSPEKSKLTILSVSEQRILESNLIRKMNSTGIGILISLNTGLRIGEVCALSWENIDFENRVMHVCTTVIRVKSDNPDSDITTKLMISTPKTKSSVRDIPISSKLYNILKEAYRETVSKYVISDTSSFISPRTYEYRFHKILNEYGISSVNYHALRHTFATRCVEAGMDVKTLSEILGHSNVSITLNTYVHSSMDLKRKQIEKLDALLI